MNHLKQKYQSKYNALRQTFDYLGEMINQAIKDRDVARATELSKDRAEITGMLLILAELVLDLEGVEWNA